MILTCSRRLLRCILAKAALCLLLCAPVYAHGQSAWVDTSTTVSHRKDLQIKGTVRPDHALHIVVALKVRNKPSLDQNVAAMVGRNRQRVNPTSAAEIERLYLPTASQAKQVADYLARSGFTDIQVAKNRLFVSANGTVAAVRTAFNTGMALASVGPHTGLVNVSPVQVPSALGAVVQSVLGLQSVINPHTFAEAGSRSQWLKAKVRGLIQTCNPGSCTCSCTCGCGGGGGAPSGLQPALLGSIYGATALQPAGKTPVGIIADGNIATTLSDLSLYASQNTLPTITPSQVYAGAKGSDTTNTVEWDIDSQTILGVADGQLESLTFYIATALTDPDLTLAYNDAVTANVVKILNVSLGECELDANSNGAIAADDPIFELAVAQGQTVSVASGDSGSAPCGTQAGQAYPATSPYVIAVGGTTLTESNGSYVSETAWSHGGGGPSAVEGQPQWQNGIVSGTARGLPDVAFDANPETGIILVLDGGASGPWGGTSIASPTFVGLMARFQSSANNTWPFPAQWIYHYPTNKRSLAFHDVTSGTNGGYMAAPGWDFTTGFGSLNSAAARGNLNVIAISQIVDYLLAN